MRSRIAVFPALFLAAACSSETSTPADSGIHPDAAAPDAAAPDATAPHDGGFDELGRPDTGVHPDAEPEDIGPADTGIPPDLFPRLKCSQVTGACMEFTADHTNEALEAINNLSNDTTIILSAERFLFDNAVTFRGANGISLLGQGIDVTTLDFSPQQTQANGVDVIGDRFTIEHLTITDSQKDGFRIEQSTDVAVRHLKVTWTGTATSANGAYAIYPVRCTNVLLEDSEAYKASDAGLYIGQSINVIVRRNKASENVAGLEIENTQFADVYENDVEGNAGGLLVFDLPGNPVIGRDIRIHDNIVRNNNHPNFAKHGTTVAGIPAGTGTFALASRRVEIAHNTYADNGTGDIAILNGLAVESSTGAWALPIGMIRGSTVGLELESRDGVILNYRTSEIWIHDNSHMGSGTTPDGSDQVARPLGALLFLIYGPALIPVDDILYDGIGEMVAPHTPAANTNNNHLCVENEQMASFATLDLPNLARMVDMHQTVTPSNLYRPAVPFVPFNCSGFTGGPIAPVMLPF